MSTIRWACLGLLVVFGAEGRQVRAVAPLPAESKHNSKPHHVQLDVVIVKADADVSRSFKKRLVRWEAIPDSKECEKGLPLVAILASSGTRSVVRALARLEKEGRAKVLARPRLVTKSGGPVAPWNARPLIVEDLMWLVFLPTILENGHIRLEAYVQLSFRKGRHPTTTTAHTTKELGPGEMVVISLPYFEREKVEPVQRLGSLYFVGQVVRALGKGHWREMLILVTPRLVAVEPARQPTSEGPRVINVQVEP
jgi:hypothetical protein